ncbi:MAG: DegT/DnrJ/EryC1/StrS family aminotransferase [Kordiimonas sp.]
MKIPFFKTEISERAIDEVASVLKSGWLTSGPQAKAFEQEFASYVGEGVQAIAVNSCTAGLHLALEALGVSEGDEVIVPTLTFTATAEIVNYLGANVVLVDVNPDTLCASFEKIEAAITNKTKAVIYVHFAGYPIDITPLVELCRRHSLRLVEDAAHAIPCRIDGKHIGTMGSDAAVFSFYANKTMTTGEGGMIVTPEHDVADRARVMRTHGISRDAFERFNGKSHLWQYDVVDAGYKYNLTDVAAALGRVQLSDVDKLRLGRLSAVSFYDQALIKLPLDLPPRPENRLCEHAWHLYVVQFYDKKVRDRAIEIMSEFDIGYSIHYTPLHNLSYWREVAVMPPDGFPAADHYFNHCLSLPLFPTLKDKEQEIIVRALEKAINNEKTL